MKRLPKTAATVAAALVLALIGCGSNSSDAGEGAATGTITLAGWSLSTTPEFKALADGFNATGPKYKVELKEYDATNYDTQMIADLSAGTAPDVYVQKNLKNFYTYQSGKQLLDVSDIAAKAGPGVKGLAPYQVDGLAYAIPYRQDAWILYYNKDLFAKAGVKPPDGSWTWDDYVRVSKQVTTGLKTAGSGALGTYQHGWQSILQGFALAQTPGAELLGGDFSYLKPYYARALDLQAAGAQIDAGTVTTNKLTYQAEFGTQKAAMLVMGSWYVATLIAQQKSGEAQTFDWGIAPVPQYDSSTTGTGKSPVTFGDPTGLGINPKIAKEKIDTAKAFLAYTMSENGATTLAGIGITPALTSEAVTKAFFAVQGAPDDDLSKFAFGSHDIRPENPVSKSTAELQNLLNTAHTSIMSKSEGIDAALATAQDQARSQVLNK